MTSLLRSKNDIGAGDGLLHPYLDHPLYKQIYRGHDVYEGLKLRALDLNGWGVAPRLYEKLVDKLKPSLVVEVGVWKGATTIALAELLKSRKLPGKVIAVDTWLGALEMWDRRAIDSSRDLLWDHGYPSVYYTFLSNVVHRSVQAQVIPFPAPSSIAASFLARHRAKIDLLHIDASHEYAPVSADLHSWWPLMDSNGVMFGDDYLGHWKDVRRAVDDFSSEMRLRVLQVGHKWLITRRNGSEWSNNATLA